MIATVVRGLELLSLASAIGGMVLEWLLPIASPPEARTRLRRWISSCLVVLLVATLVEIVVRTQTMSGAPLAASVATVPDVLRGTHFGQILTARLATLVVAVSLSLARPVALRLLGGLAALGVALSFTLAGHAADWGDLTVSVAVDWIHAMAASAWSGGLIALALVVIPRRTPWPREPLGTLASRFSRLATLCLLAVILTGTYNAWVQLGGLQRLWATTYGLALIAKLLMVATLICLGATSRYLLIPRLAPARAARGFGARLFRASRLVIFGPRRRVNGAAPESRLTEYVTAEAFVALGVFVCTAMLGEITPGRHVAFERRVTTHVTPLMRPGGGGARAGTMTPPPGDVTRGRAVFAKLQCATCHATPGFSAATRPGPDLSGIGARYPGELVESIMNPNAQIVDGPGYVDERGLSTMPDYRDRLTVGELIDLVEYLKSLGEPRPPKAERSR